MSSDLIHQPQYHEAIQGIRFGHRNWERTLHGTEPVASGLLTEVGLSNTNGTERVSKDITRHYIDTPRMKYVVLSVGGTEQMFVFPMKVDHDNFVEAMCHIRYDAIGFKHDDRGLGDVISAGFVERDTCSGKSETLNISSRPVIDTTLFNKQMRENWK